MQTTIWKPASRSARFARIVHRVSEPAEPSVKTMGVFVNRHKPRLAGAGIDLS